MAVLENTSGSYEMLLPELIFYLVWG